jgi:hypothetical protein
MQHYHIPVYSLLVTAFGFYMLRTAGLDSAVQRLSPGHCACIIGTPRLAYGEAGLPPHVPKNSHVVWRIEVVEGGGPPDSSAPEGPPLLLLPKALRTSLSPQSGDDSEAVDGSSSSAPAAVLGAVVAPQKRPQLAAASPPAPLQPRAVPASVSIAEAADTDALLAKFAAWNAGICKSPSYRRTDV